MSQIDPTTVDVDDVIRRIQAARRGDIPEDSVSIEELRAAIDAQRQRFREAAPAKGTSTTKTKSKTTGKTINVASIDLGI